MLQNAENAVIAIYVFKKIISNQLQLFPLEKASIKRRLFMRKMTEAARCDNFLLLASIAAMRMPSWEIADCDGFATIAIGWRWLRATPVSVAVLPVHRGWRRQQMVETKSLPCSMPRRSIGGRALYQSAHFPN